jgi:hypothetical protein
MATVSGMFLEVLLLIVVLAIGGRLIYRHFAKPAQTQQPDVTEQLRATIAMTGPDGVSTVREVMPSNDGGTFDEWVAEQEQKRRRLRSGGPAKIVAAHLDEHLPRIDLRELPSSRFRIVGTAHWVTDAERARHSGQEYQLVREPENEYDASAVAVYGRGRKVGYLSAAKAAGVAPELDRLGEAAFIVSGDSVSEQSIRMWVDIPRLPGLRAFRSA